MTINPDRFLINTLQPTCFMMRVIWNIKGVPGVPTKQSAVSAGGGIRLIGTKYITGNFMIAQPLTKPVAAEALIGRGKNTRMFFSIVAQD